MNNRHFEEKNLNESLANNDIPHVEWIKAFVKTFGTGFVVATGCYPIEYLKTRSILRNKSVEHLSQKPIEGTMLKGGIRFLPSFMLANYKPILHGFNNAIKASLVKNTVISNHKPVHNHFDEMMSDRESMHIQEQGKGEGEPKKIKATLLTSAFIGFFDTFFTNYYSNLRVRNAMGEIPFMKEFNQKIKFAMLGFNPRLCRNSANALFCISTTTILQGYMDKLLPEADYGKANLAATTIVSGMMGGLTTNAFDVMHNRIIQQANVIQFKAPSMIEMTRILMSERGARSFFRGAFYTVPMTVVAYAGINAVDYYVNNKLFPNKHAQPHSSRFFSSEESQPAETSAPQAPTTTQRPK